MTPTTKRYFPVGGPVAPEDVVDREAFMETMAKRLVDGQSILLPGPRRIGKTTLTYEVLRRLRAEGYYTALVDVFAVATKRDLAEKMADALLENRSGVKRTVRRLRELARGVVRGAEIKADLRGLELALTFGQDVSDDELLEQVLDLPEVLAQRDQKRVIVAFDEFQDIAKLGGNELFKKLRSHFQCHENVSYLFLGSHAGMLRELFSQGRQAFYRFAIPLEVPPVPVEAWREYIQRKFAARDIEAPAESVERLIGLTGGHPQDTMIVSGEVYYALLELGLRSVTPEAVTLGYERAMEELANVFNETWDTLSSQRQAQAVVKRLVSGERPYAGGGHSNEVARALDLLIEMGLIEKIGRGEYRFMEPMFAEHVRRL